MAEPLNRAVASPARHQLADIDMAALEAARTADRLLAAAKAFDNERWARYLERIPDQLRDEPMPSLRSVARRARSAYGPKDSIRDALPEDVTEPFLEAIDHLIKAIARDDAHRG